MFDGAHCKVWNNPRKKARLVLKQSWNKKCWRGCGLPGISTCFPSFFPVALVVFCWLGSLLADTAKSKGDEVPVVVVVVAAGSANVNPKAPLKRRQTHRCIQFSKIHLHFFPLRHQQRCENRRLFFRWPHLHFISLLSRKDNLNKYKMKSEMMIVFIRSGKSFPN